MKKNILVLAVLLGGVALVGCTPKGAIRVKDANLVKAYGQQLEKSKACKVDADCVAVDKGCCLCDGKTAVNKKFENSLSTQRAEACGIGPCTLQMCYTDIDVSCVNGACAGTPKPMQGFAVAN